MNGIVPYVRYCAKERLYRQLRNCHDAGMRVRYLIIVNLVNGRSAAPTAKALGVSVTTVYRVARRFREEGEAGLVDRREDNGQEKLTEEYLAKLYDVVASSPLEHGWRRPTWTREMLVGTLQRITGVKIHVTTMSRALKTIGARRGKPKPTVDCPWSKQAKHRRLRQIKDLVDNLPWNEVVLYEDEVDIDLNPKIGLDWMVPGQQKEVPTPGQNEKRYLAGAQDVRTGQLIWVVGDKKNSRLFIQLLWDLVQRYPKAKVIHVILDNYSIHDSQQVRLSLNTPDGRCLRLHPLPPYCPEYNKIERTWEDLHANVTRNHQCMDMDELIGNVLSYLEQRNQRATPSRGAVA
jgi:transposase